jgi:hypothetical protein
MLKVPDQVSKEYQVLTDKGLGLKGVKEQKSTQVLPQLGVPF